MSYDIFKGLSIDWNGKTFVTTIRSSAPGVRDYIYSYDGLNWTTGADISNSTFLVGKDPYMVKWLGDKYVVCGGVTTSSGNTILKSSDGTSFSRINITNSSQRFYEIEENIEFNNTITFPKDVTLALGGASGDSTKIAYSLDGGISWTPSSNSSSIFSNSVNNALWNGKLWVAVGSGGNSIATSVDGNTWVGRGSYIFTTAGYGISWSNEKTLWVAGGEGTNSLAYSYDGVYWTGLGNSIINPVYDIQWNGSLWVAAGSPIRGNKSIAYSYDGLNWQLPAQTNLFDISAQRVFWNGSFWIGIGKSSVSNNSYNMTTSVDGVTWNMINNTSFTNEYLLNMYLNPNTNITFFTTYTFASPPTNLISTTSTDTTATISFTPPVTAVISYTITAVPTSGTSVSQTFSAPATSYTITGLQSGIPYTISMISTNILGNSPSSSSIVVIPKTYVATTVTHSVSGAVVPNTYISGSDSYTYYTLNNTSGSYTFTPGTDVSSIQLLIIGGGGAGGTIMGGGGGAGGFLYYPTYSVTPLSAYSSITIGAGGAGIVQVANATGNIGARGGNTTFNSIVAYGGGGGSFDNYSNISVTASNINGGSGGGKGGFAGGAYLIGPGTGTAGQGNNGATNSSRGAGGGGGSSSSGDASGNGGDGTLCTITGKSVYYAGGGSGMVNYYIGRNLGGLGGGGPASGSDPRFYAVDALDGINYGSGGGGGLTSNSAFVYNGGSGASGVVIIAFKTVYSSVLPPTNLSVSAFTSTTISVSFTAPSGSVTNYLATITSPLGDVITQSFSAPTTSCTITGLLPGLSYTIKLATLNSTGRSVDSSGVTQITKICYAITYPDTYSSFYWFDPGASSYKSQYIDISGGFAYKNGRYTASASGVSDIYLSNGIPSNAFNIINKNSIFNATNYVYGSTYVGTANTTYNGTISASGEWLQIQLPYSMNIKSYTIFGADALSTKGLLLGSTNGTTWSLVSKYFNYSMLDALPFNGPLTTNVSSTLFYSYYRCVFINAGSNTVYLSSLTLNGIVDISTSGALNPPTNLTVTSYTYNSISISFTPPTGTITNYTISAVAPDGSITTKTFASPASSYVITGLQPNTSYNITMNATNTSVTSVNSNVISQTTATGLTITFPDSYASFTLSGTYATDTFSNTVKTLTVSGATTARNGTYTVTASSAYNSQYVPYFAFINGTPPNPWRSGSISTSLGPNGILAYSSGGYNAGIVFQGGGGINPIPIGAGSSRGAYGEWIQIQFPFSINLTGMTVNGSFNSGYILGSTNGSTWALINLCFTTGYKTPTMTNESKTFTFTTPNNYSYIRLVVSNFNMWDTTSGTTNIYSISYTGTVIV
jgi:hypothetical protein